VFYVLLYEHTHELEVSAIKVNHTSPIPLHVQVEELLRNLLDQPQFKNGAFLPKEVELAKKLGVSRNTIRQATNKLEYEGLITRKKGVGTKVSGKAITTSLTEWHSFTQEMSSKGIPFTNLDIKVAWVIPEEHIANFLNVKGKVKVLKLSRLKGAKEPFVFFESYFQPRIGLTGKEDFNRHLYDILEQDYHSTPALSKEHIRAELAGDLAKILNVKKSDPILVRERFVSDPGNRPLEYNMGYYRSDKFAYSIDIKI